MTWKEKLAHARRVSRAVLFLVEASIEHRGHAEWNTKGLLVAGCPWCALVNAAKVTP